MTGAAKKPVLNLDHYVPALLTWLSNKLARNASHIYLKQFELGIVEWRMLSYLAVYEQGTGAEMSQLMGLDKSALSRSGVFLQKRKFIRSQQGFGKKVVFLLTPAGKQMHDRIIHLALAREQTLLTGLNKVEVETLIKYLHVLLGNLPAVEAIDYTKY
jgi:DNA-binding MarR family transcriptional regulator